MDINDLDPYPICSSISNLYLALYIKYVKLLKPLFIDLFEKIGNVFANIPFQKIFLPSFLLLLALVVFFIRKKLYRRLSDWRMGYRRPPFHLIKCSRERCFCLSFLRAGVIGNKMFWGWHYSKSHEKSEDCSKSSFPNPNLPNTVDALYLWPDRLRWHYCWFALITAIPFLFCIQEECKSECNNRFIIIIFLMCFTVFIAPFFIYRVCRIPVLEGLCELPPLPRSMRQWFKDQFPETITPRDWFKTPKWWRIVLNDYIPSRSEELDSTTWLQASSRKTFIKLALAEFHQSISEDGIGNDWTQRAIYRWFFYWCGPVWSSYLALWLALPLISPSYETQSVFAIMLWLCLSAYFVWRQPSEFKHYTELSIADRNMLALPLLPHIDNATHAVEKLTQDKVKAVIFSLQGILLIFYLYALQIIPNQPVNNDEPMHQITSLIESTYQLLSNSLKTIQTEFKHE